MIHDAANGFALGINQSVSGDDSGSSLGPVQAPLGRASIVKTGHNLLARVAALGETHCAIAVVVEVLRQVAADRLALDTRALVFDLQPEWVRKILALTFMRCAPTFGVLRTHRHRDCHERRFCEAQSRVMLIC